MNDDNQPGFRDVIWSDDAIPKFGKELFGLIERIKTAREDLDRFVKQHGIESLVEHLEKKRDDLIKDGVSPEEIDMMIYNCKKEEEAKRVNEESAAKDELKSKH